MIISSNSKFWSPFTWLVMALLCSSSLLAQPNIPISGGTVGDLLDAPAFLKASALKDSFRYDESIEEFRAVALAHPDTEIEATALCQVANLLHLRSSEERRLGNTGLATQLESESQAEYQIIVQKFPNTKYWFKARAALSDSEEDFDSLMIEAGGVARADIRSGLIKKIPPNQIPLQFRQSLQGAYELMGDTTQERSRFLQFVRLSFPSTSSTIWDLRHIYHPHEITDDTLDTIPPSIEILHPLEGVTVSPSDASLKCVMNDGDLTGRQIDLSNSTIELDGQTVFKDCAFDSELSPEGPIFELITVTYTPPVPLSLGTHTYRVIAKEVGGEKQTERLIHFTVGTPPPPPPISLNPIMDTIIYERGSHVNEGANALLTLEKIQGKTSRSVVAFDLSTVDLNTVSRATLVLTVDPNQPVNGWGNGRTVSAQALNSPWLEGNGKSLGLKKKDQVTGSGTGATWFSPSDEDISNDSANSAFHWNGAETSASPPTSPAVQIVNFQSGEVTFDVTADVLNGAEHGWLILKDQENVGSKVSFYSREGAAAAGNPDLAPRLLLEYGQVASISSEAQSETLLSRIGFGAIGTKLRPVSGREVRSVKQLLQENRVAALAVEQLVSQATLTNPVANWSTRLAYRSWVWESIQIAANIEMAKS